MSIKLIQDKAKLPSSYTLTYNLTNGYKRNSLFWGKVCTTNSETFLGMQLPVTCKDYMVDTQYRSNSNIHIDNWSKEQLHENAFYIVFINDVQKDLFLDQMKVIFNINLF